MLDHGIAAAKLFLAVVLNAVGFVALLAVAWLMPRVLELIVRSGVIQG